MNAQRCTQLILLWGLLVVSVSLVYAEPVLQVTPDAVNFGEVEVYSTDIKTEEITISNCGDGVLCWGIVPDDAWLTVEGNTSGEINLPDGDARYVQETLGACGLCITVELEEDEIVGEHSGSFTIYQYSYDESGSEPHCTTIVDTIIRVTATMTIPDDNILEVDPLEVDFGKDDDELTFDIKNTGEGEMEWEALITGDVDWLTFEGETTASGTVTGGGLANSVTLTVDRSKIEGCIEEVSTTVKVASPNALPAEVIISVTAGKEIIIPNPSSPTPVNGTTDQSLYATLKWQSGGTQGDIGGIVYYDIYFSANQTSVENSSPSALVCDDISVSYCDPAQGGGTLDAQTTYYWRVKAIDECEENEVYSDIWSFTTGQQPGSVCPVSTVLLLSEHEISLLRTLRDEVLVKSESGQKYVTLYYSPYALEALLIMLFNADLRMCAEKIVEDFLPALQALVRDGEACIDSVMRADVKQFLEEFEKEVSPGLKEIIEDVKKDVATGVLFKNAGFSLNK